MPKRKTVDSSSVADDKSAKKSKPLEEQTVAELKKIATSLNLDTTGKKSVLIDRIKKCRDETHDSNGNGNGDVAMDENKTSAVVVQRQEDAISTVLLNDFLAAFVFSFIPVSDLIVYRQVSKRWHAITNINSLWFFKYVRAANITSVLQNVKIDTKPEGHFRKMYLDRFGRDDLLKVLVSNFQNTKKAKYIEAYEMLATATAYSYEETNNKSQSTYLQSISDSPADSANVPVLLINKLVSQSAKYAQLSNSTVDSRALTAIATLYANNSTRSVKICLEVAHTRDDRANETRGTINILALYDNLTTPEHLCQFSTYDEEEAKKSNNSNLVLVHDAYVEPITTSCETLLKYLSFPTSTTAKHLVAALANVAVKLSKNESNALDSGAQKPLTRIAALDKIPPPPSRDDNGATVQYYKSLAARARGDFQQVHAIEVAKARNFYPFIYLLENTTFFEFQESVGRPKPWLYGGAKHSQHQLAYTNKAVFQLSLLLHPPILITTAMTNNMLEDDHSHPERMLSVKVGDTELISTKHGEEFETSGIASTLTAIVNEMKLYGFNHVDFFNYLIVAGNLQDQLIVSGDKKTQWYTLHSLEGIKLVQASSNEARQLLYLHLKNEAEKLKREVHWDGKQPEGFTKWQYVKDEAQEDDCAAGRSDHVDQGEKTGTKDENGDEGNKNGGDENGDEENGGDDEGEEESKDE